MTLPEFLVEYKLFQLSHRTCQFIIANYVKEVSLDPLVMGMIGDGDDWQWTSDLDEFQHPLSWVIWSHVC